MPIYEFCCDDCGHEFESLQRLSDPLPDACPSCGKPNVQKKISAAGFRLKGGGWYETDFKSGAKKNVSGSDSGSGSGGSSESSSGSSASADAKSGSSETKSASAGSKKD